MVSMEQTAKEAKVNPDVYTFDLGTKGTHVVDTSRVVNIDVNKLNSELADQAANYLRFATLVSLVKEKRDRASEELKFLEGKVDGSIRDMAKSSGEKITEAVVRARIDTDDEVLSHKHKLFQVETELSIAMAIKEAFHQRKDMLVTLGANLRAEMDAHIHINQLKG